MTPEQERLVLESLYDDFTTLLLTPLTGKARHSPKTSTYRMAKESRSQPPKFC